MENMDIELWKPIKFDDAWASCDTSILDDLTPSWYKRRQELREGNQDYEEFIDRLKRQHAIETGVIEKLYDLSEGITETFIREGFVESYLSHDDTNIPPAQLMSYLKDHFEAMDFIFDMVKNERPITLGFIRQLHQLVTQHQDHATAINTLGERVQVRLLKGEFKQADNNPRREDGRVFKYCPYLQVVPEMEKLLGITTELYAKDTHPVIISAWFHHAFTQIHPFQDGNGRMARLLASLILIRDNLFPLTIQRAEKTTYIDALEQADAEIPQPLVSLFCTMEKKNIEHALNYRSLQHAASMEEVAKLFADKVDTLNARNKDERRQILDKNRTDVFMHLGSLVNDITRELLTIIPTSKADITVESVFPDQPNYFWYTPQVEAYAAAHDYYFNRHLPRGWFRISFSIAERKRYDVVATVHHFGFEDSVIAVGAFLEFTEQLAGDREENTTIPIHLKPFTMSLEGDIAERMNNMSHYVRDVVKVGMTIIVNEIG